ncbi:PREDICTED: mitogen-activated protein kinase kinase kinase MLT-like [Miniopterus natalensis]|uniref:mitogen-activated protein kinase kinase kinase MLT-like n=1 Tax=Miniopterus natalensis TaxID=291302 RepID=UPI0007A6FF3C|nr:PREDICTED: mitogen-activated protein kinase kinase kinase MLT-like [Miniopterus natalensis]
MYESSRLCVSSLSQYLWVQQLLRKGDSSAEMSVYASLFKENNITGKRLLLLEEEDLKDMGIVSKGHIIHLKSAIEKLTHDYLNLFHFPPLIKDSVGEPEENEEKIVNLELVFGFHLKPGTSSQDCKWKMYMEMDGDDIAVTYIKDVTFNTNLPGAEILKMTKPPFVMEKWIVGIMENQTVECTVTYESDVRAPKSTKHVHSIQWTRTKPPDEVKAVQLAIQTLFSSSEGNPRSRSDSSADCQWLDTLRLRQIASHTSLQRSQSNPMLGSHFPYFSDQDSYAAAVRRTQAPVKHQQITPINQSRSSSPTQYALTKNFSSLHLSSRDSGFSSLTPDSSAERAQYSGRSRSKYERGSGSLTHLYPDSERNTMLPIPESYGNSALCWGSAPVNPRCAFVIVACFELKATKTLWAQEKLLRALPPFNYLEEFELWALPVRDYQRSPNYMAGETPDV